MTTDRPSIAELQRDIAIVDDDNAHGKSWSVAADRVCDAAPVFLKIAAAALAWHASDDEDRADELEALIAAIAKVRQ